MKRSLGWMMVALAACGSKATSGGSASGAPSASASASSSASGAEKPGRTTFEVVLAADDVDLFPMETSDLPRGGSLLNESVPIGTQRRVIPKELVDQVCGAKVEGQPPIQCQKSGEETFVEVPVGVSRNFLRVVAGEGESLDALRERILAYGKTKALPPGARIVLAKLDEPDPETKKLVTVGFRTYVVRGEPALTERDIQSAKADDLEGTAIIMITLTPEAAARFEKFTGDNVMRRLALVVDGFARSAPVVQGKIAGGHLSIAMSASEKSTPAERAEATRLAKALGGGG